MPSLIHPPFHPEGCRLLVGPAAASAQLVLAVIAFVSLVYKRHTEKPQRPVSVWAMDVSKQVFSALVAHFAGMGIAIVLATQAHVSECAWYFVAFTFDTTLGVAIALGLHTAAVRTARHFTKKEKPHPVLLSIAECGNYGTPPSVWRLWPQLIEFSTAVLLARMLCGSLIILLRGSLAHIAGLLDSIFKVHTTAELFFVMIACPLTMNVLQAIIQDTVLKRHKHADAEADAADAAEGGVQMTETQGLIAAVQPGGQINKGAAKAEASPFRMPDL
ncbi:hypothetical protein WJX73_000180 [Symbiochloris irregularis]|uniref:Uncharacterized protein n=1 Tax=Symbiochloris irregularis TaxID=706552 RepID=A0AAW1P7R1_9CHLO